MNDATKGPRVPADRDRPRCIDCGYYLVGLNEPRCPECGRRFDLSDPKSYTFKPPLLRLKLWFPGFMLAFAVGVVLFAGMLLATKHVGWAATIAAPGSVGVLGGYRWRIGVVARGLLALSLLAAIVAVLVFADISGVLCGIIAGVVMAGPVLVGAYLGLALRERLKMSEFSQRYHLPIWIMFAGTITLWLLEAKLSGPIPERSISTEVVAPMPVDAAWRRIRFYEELPRDRPLAFRIGAPTPLYTTGGRDEPGDIRTCVYERGRVVKRISRVERYRRLEFEILEQSIHVEHDVKLIRGGFEFESAGPNQTRIRLTTTYQPLLRPRFCWQPFEEWVTHTLHNHILRGMQDKGSAMNDRVAVGAPE